MKFNDWADLELINISNQLRIRLKLTHNTTDYTYVPSTSGYILSYDDWHSIETHIKSDQTSGGGTLYVNNAKVGEEFSLNTRGRNLEAFRIGCFNLTSGTTGTIYFDEAVVDTNPIGALAVVCNYEYDCCAATLRKVTYPNNFTANYQYDSLNRLTTLANLDSSNNVISSYQMDNAGMRTKVTMKDGDYIDYTYDKLYQLMSETRKDSGGSTEYYRTYTFDSVGNRLTMCVDGSTSTYNYNSANEIVSSTDSTGVATYSFDENGNQIKKIHSVDGKTLYFYDFENRLERIVYPDDTSSKFSYCAFGKRIAKQDPDKTMTTYIYDGWDVIGEKDRNHNVQTVYQRNIDPTGIGNIVRSIRDGYHYYFYDGLGSVTNITDVYGIVESTYVYEGYGNILSEAQGITNPWKFVTREWDSDSNLYYLRARYYDPGTGGFITLDPVLGDIIVPLSLNRYIYVRNNPVTWIDPSGKALTCPKCYKKKLVGGRSLVVWL